MAFTIDTTLFGGCFTRGIIITEIQIGIYVVAVVVVAVGVIITVVR